MTQEYKQFWNAMWIIIKKDVAPAVLITGLVALGATYLHKHKDVFEEKTKEKNSLFYPKKEMMNFYNPFAKVK